MKVNNYLVTGADLATMGYVKKPGATPPLDGNIMNKGEADANYYIDQSAIPWSTYTNDRAPKYQDYPCPCVGEVTVYNDLEGAIDQYVTYQDCSGNGKTQFVAAGTAVVIVGCTTQDPGGYTGCGILRGSIYGSGLREITYGNCCPGFGPCTTTTTTTVYIPTCNYNGFNIVCNSPTSATLSWSFNEGIGATGEMILYLNGNVIEDRNSSSTGTWPVNVGDTINVEISSTGCSGNNGTANAWTVGIIADAACGSGSTNLFTGVYTVTSGDIGNTLTLNAYATCDSGCV
jgi:hypothetical protein